MQLSDRVTGTVLAVLGAAAAYGGSLLPAVPGQDVGPAAFPLLIGGGLVACGVLIALGIGQGFEAPEELEPGEVAPVRGLAARVGGWAVLVPPALLLLYVLLADRLGFLLTAALVVLGMALAMGARPRLAVPLAVAAPLFVSLVFGKLLRVPLPEGLLAAPW